MIIMITEEINNPTNKQHRQENSNEQDKTIIFWSKMSTTEKGKREIIGHVVNEEMMKNF